MTFLRFARIGRQRVRSLLRRGALDRELERELAFHFDALVQENLARGLPAAEAQHSGREALGDMTRLGEACRDARGLRWLDDLLQDAGFAARMLRRQLGLTITAVLSLALGIGGTAAVIRAMDAARGESLHLADAGRYVSIASISPSGSVSPSSPIDFVAWRDRTATVFDAIGASRRSQQTLDATPDGLVAERVSALSVTASFFDAGGIRLMMGRSFSQPESRLLDPIPAVIISEHLWRARYQSESAILSRAIVVDGAARRVVGVAPAVVRYQDGPVDIWLPLRIIPNDLYGRGRGLRVIARLRPGVDTARAQAALQNVSASVAHDRPQIFSGWTVRVQSLAEARLGWTRQRLAVLFTIAALVLVIACANVAGLLVARASACEPEIRIRAALGAGRARLARQWIAEGLCLGGLGGAVGLAIAWSSLRGLTALFPPPGDPALAPLGLDWRIAAITTGTSLLAAVLLSVVPASLLSTTAFGSRAWPRAARVMAVVQVAVAFVVLVGSGLLVNSLVRLGTRDFAFAPDHLLAFDIAVPPGAETLATYHGRPYFTVASSPIERFSRVIDAMRSVPGVEAVGGSTFRAIDAFVVTRFAVETGNRTASGIACAAVTPEYFAAMRTPILRGRDVAATDLAASPWVAIVNEAAAAGFWPGAEALGQTITMLNRPGEQPRTVVGIVPDIPLRQGGLAAEPIVYVSYLQQPPHLAGTGSMSFVARYTGDPRLTAVALQRAAARVDPNLPLASMGTVEQHLATGRANLSTMVRLACGFAVVALLLACVGIYGIVAYGVNRRMRDLAIRKALGARTRDLVVSVGRYVTWMLAAGFVLGLIAALPLAHAIRSQLWGTTWTDPATYGLACLILLTAAAVACLAPARRAIRVDPTMILRTE